MRPVRKIFDALENHQQGTTALIRESDLQMLIYCSNSRNCVNPSRWSSIICLEKFQSPFLKHLPKLMFLKISLFLCQYLYLTRFILLFLYRKLYVRLKRMSFGSNNDT